MTVPCRLTRLARLSICRRCFPALSSCCRHAATTHGDIDAAGDVKSHDIGRHTPQPSRCIPRDDVNGRGPSRRARDPFFRWASLSLATGYDMTPFPLERRFLL